MCTAGWDNKRYNPSDVKVTVREYKHSPASMFNDPSGRGGPETSDHVDIMGNHQLMRDILHVACGRIDQVPPQIHSDIISIAERVDLSGLGSGSE
jgi:phospholipid:diacylglycerol acyltransferase